MLQNTEPRKRKATPAESPKPTGTRRISKITRPAPTVATTKAVTARAAAIRANANQSSSSSSMTPKRKPATKPPSTSSSSSSSQPKARPAWDIRVQRWSFTCIYYGDTDTKKSFYQGRIKDMEAVLKKNDAQCMYSTKDG